MAKDRFRFRFTRPRIRVADALVSASYWDTPVRNDAMI